MTHPLNTSNITTHHDYLTTSYNSYYDPFHHTSTYRHHGGWVLPLSRIRPAPQSKVRLRLPGDPPWPGPIYQPLYMNPNWCINPVVVGSDTDNSTIGGAKILTSTTTTTTTTAAATTTTATTTIRAQPLILRSTVSTSPP